MKNLYIVIHTESEDQLRRNIERLDGIKIAGVFLINHGKLNYKQLYRIGNKLKKDDPNLWIGYNFLDLGSSAFTYLKDKEVDGLWVDNSFAGLNLFKLKTIDKARIKSKFKGLYFGGFAFKGQIQPPSMERACEDCKTFIDVPTTSGVGTGIAVDIDKIKVIYKYLGSSYRLAVASGITSENVGDYLPYVSDYIVSTGVSDSFTEINTDKVRKLSNLIYNYS